MFGVRKDCERFWRRRELLGHVAGVLSKCFVFEGGDVLEAQGEVCLRCQLST